MHKQGYKSSKSKASSKSGKSKNMKDLFLKKLQTCMKIYDYKDETKDVKGKSERLSAINETPSTKVFMLPIKIRNCLFDIFLINVFPIMAA